MSVKSVAKNAIFKGRNKLLAILKIIKINFLIVKLRGAIMKRFIVIVLIIILANFAYAENINLVKRAQLFLDKLGYNPGPIDGHFGNTTQKSLLAVRNDFPWMTDSNEINDITVAELFILTLPVEYHGPPKKSGEKCEGSLMYKDGHSVLNMGNCPESHICWLQGAMARVMVKTKVRELIYDGKVKGEVNTKFKATVQNEPENKKCVDPPKKGP